MRCINMKIIDVLLFLINIMAIYSNVIPHDKVLQPVDNRNLNKFERDCPDLWKVIEDNNLIEWTNCQNKSVAKTGISEEDVLQFACFLAKNMMLFMCDQKLNMTNDYLRLPESNICPFEFSELTHIGFSVESKLAKELTIKEHCLKVCYDLYETRVQCVILRKLNNYLLSYGKQFSRLGLLLPDAQNLPEVNNHTLKAVKQDDKPVEQRTSKETTTKSKTETTSNKNATSPVKPDVDKPKKLDPQKPELQTSELQRPETQKSVHPRPEPQNPAHETPELQEPEPEKSISPKTDKVDDNNADLEIHLDEENKEELNMKNDDIENPEGAFGNDDLVDSSQINHLKGEVKEVAEIQGNTWLAEKEKVQLPFNQKEINPNDGFLQAEDSHFFFYFIVVSSVIVIGYIGFHNKNKILAYALEGTSGRRSRRRPNPARYRKLETNLEEAISSNASETVASSVVY